MQPSRCLYLICISMLCFSSTSGRQDSKSRRKHNRSNPSQPPSRLSRSQYESELHDDESKDDSRELSMSSDFDSTASSSVAVTEIPAGRPYDIFTCCAIVFGSCRSSCENLSLLHLADWNNSERAFRLELKKFCPSMQFEFWACMNHTLEAVALGSEWTGRRCCKLGLSPRCRSACAISASTDELASGCRQSDEQRMFACFERQEAGDRCCDSSRTPECLQACRDVFETHASHQRNTRHRLHESCSASNQDVVQCVSNVTHPMPTSNSHKYLPCCELSKVDTCRNTCRAALNTSESTDIIIAELESGGCGTPLPHLPLWQCFLTADRKKFTPVDAAVPAHAASSQINEIGIDSAKLHCCSKAATPKCRRLCLQTYSNDWTTASTHFESQCLVQPTELELRRCIDEVEESCELGCDGLSFCVQFNNRPTELFRSCNAQADAAARSDLKMWQERGFLNLPGVTLPIKNITSCAPEKWLAIACILQVKPCARAGHYNHICYEDCYEILSECIDWSRISTNVNAVSICMRLHPQEEEIPCVSLRPYLELSRTHEEASSQQRIAAPCKERPCNASEVCLLRRNESNAYECVPACTLGDASSYLVPVGAYVRVPVYTAYQGAFRVCRCGFGGHIAHCQPLPILSYDNCVLPGGRSFKHGTSFYLECNLCSCYAEEITCTKKQCKLPGVTDTAYTSLPCNCPAHYAPVCGRNGNTYHSACIARCLGLQDVDIEHGACVTWNPCQEGAYKCPAGTSCLEQRQICLSTMHRPCAQYKCVNQTKPCDHDGLPACDTRGLTHPSACDLLNAQAQLAHWGSCYSSCSWKGPICGINGVTYQHECAAWADFVLVDYHGRCREIGLLAHGIGRRCRTVKCPNPPSVHCPTVVPPGACCPICAGAFRVIYSRKQVDRAFYAMRDQNTRLITLHSVLRELDALVQFSDCQLTGFLTMEVGIFVGIVPRTTTPARLLIEACMREAEKIANLIEAQAHHITTNLVLSGLTVAHMIKSTTENGAGCSMQDFRLLSLTWQTVLLAVVKHILSRF